MDNPKSSFKARASLMDRLVDQHPASHREARPLRTLSRKRLKESLSRDLEWLLNTRTSLPAAVFDEMDLTVIDYGIPDFGSCFTANEEDHKRLAGRVKKAITV
ncbi:MAG: type VI secretion system baseplate subunit TssE, partial [Desulfobacterales bacterium]|nr:type VI secretion system baseplate subunit TssE [Desulfobacterales bacterium]